MNTVSIVLATYNGAAYIEKQMLSIMKQTHVVNQVIICDDHSSDNTVTLVRGFIQRYKLERWEVYVNETRVGYKRNFYNLMKKATSTYIFLADQDDEWHSNKLEKMLAVMQTDTAIRALSSGVHLIDSFSNELSCSACKKYHNCNFLYFSGELARLQFFDLCYIMKHNISPGCTMCITQDIKEIFIDTYKFELPHDWFLNMIAATRNGCAFLNEVTVDYRQHSNNAIGANTSFLMGVKRKSREFFKEEYIIRLNAVDVLVENKLANQSGLESCINLLEKMIDFYQKPTPFKLISLYRMDGYSELSKLKVKAWNVMIAVRLDRIISKLVVCTFIEK